MAIDQPYALPGQAADAARTQSRAIFGQVMGLVALTLGFTALGAYIGRDFEGIGVLFLFLAAIGCIIGLNIAAARGAQGVAITLLFGMGLLMGIAVGSVLAAYAKAEPGVLYQAAGATALFIAGFGAWGYATRRDLSGWARGLFWALLGLIAVGLVLTFVAIPGGNLIYCILGLVVFAAYTMFDFNRLRRADDERMAVPIAASIFLDIFNVFLFMLQLFGNSR